MPELHPFTTNRWLQELNNQNTHNNWIINQNSDGHATSFAYIPNEQTKSIFLGTFPIYEISAGQNHAGHIEFFYGSNNNSFWPILRNLFNINIENVIDRTNFLNANSFGITDILLEIDRIGVGNQDININHICYNDIMQIIEQFPELQNIFVTSGGKGVIPNLNNNNKSVLTWLRDYAANLAPNGFNMNGFIKNITIQGTPFNLIVLYSPSNSNNQSIQRILNLNHNFGIQNLNVLDFKKFQWAYFLKNFHFENDAPQLLENIYQQVIANPALNNFFAN